MGELNVNYEWVKNKLPMNDEWIMIKLQVRLKMLIHDVIHNIISSFNNKFHKEQSWVCLDIINEFFQFFQKHLKDVKRTAMLIH